ncbi:hypothetical protein BH09BAC5_BH09BAC5_29670 [soil metagenome]
MENGPLHDDKLFRAVHDRLSDYEAPANGADWDAMSRSLDNLPKSSAFRFKISLNSILVLIGIVGISAIGFAVVNHNGKSAEKNQPDQISISQPQENQQKVVPVNNPNIVSNNQNSFTNNNSMTDVAANNEKVNQDDAAGTTMKNSSSVSSTPEKVADGNSNKGQKKSKNKLLFGDQIDPKKGFIYNTGENNNVVTQPVTDPLPGVFYDKDANGNLKKIEIKKDTTVKSSSKTKIDSTAKSSTPGAPTNGEKTGFDFQKN